MDSRNPALGAKLVARAWVDPEFRARLLANGRAACEELGISFFEDTQLMVVENTDKVHNILVCTLCSCYPREILGLPPDWYKLKPYRARAVKEPRAVLAELGTVIPTMSRFAFTIRRQCSASSCYRSSIRNRIKSARNSLLRW
jgi:thiocyanate hydrolase subunit gamma